MWESITLVLNGITEIGMVSHGERSKYNKIQSIMWVTSDWGLDYGLSADSGSLMEC